jgi:hypothetical protein
LLFLFLDWILIFICNLGQSKNAGKSAIEEILALIETKESLQKEIQELDKILAGDNGDVLELADQRATAVEHMERLKALIMKKHQYLGVDGQQSLAKLKASKFLQKRVNALALKTRIRKRLRDRKFELDRLERAYRQTTSNEAKLSSHIHNQVKRHEPSIVQLVTKYNKLCTEMLHIKTVGNAPANHLVPTIIEKAGLFQLDVDDDIWQDIGLNDDIIEGSASAWLCDKNTRRGIKALLELDRCIEEEERLSKERCVLQEWFMEEWEIVQIALSTSANDPSIQYQLNLRKNFLCYLYISWEPKIRPVPKKYVMPEAWGPSNAEQSEALQFEYMASWDIVSEDDDNDDDSEPDMGDEDLLDAIESSEFYDVYQQEHSTSNVGWNTYDFGLPSTSPSVLLSGPSSRSTSPKKRIRTDDDS